MWNGLKSALKIIGTAGIHAVADLPALAISSPSLIIALKQLGVKISAEVLAEAVRRLSAAGVADPRSGAVESSNPLWAPFHLAMAEHGDGPEVAASSAELRSMLESVHTPVGVWGGLLHVLADSPIAALGESLERRETAKAGHFTAGCDLACRAFDSAVVAAGSVALEPLKPAAAGPASFVALGMKAARGSVVPGGNGVFADLKKGKTTRKTAAKFAQPVAQTPSRILGRRAAAKVSKVKG